MNIPAGYQLQVTSWTNDSDNYNTTIHSGLTESDVNFLVDVVKPFKSQHSAGGKFGNNDSCTEEVESHIYDCYLKHKDGLSEGYLQWFEETDEDNVDDLSDLAYDLLGRDEYCGWRVLDSYKVFFFPEECENVTDKFN